MKGLTPEQIRADLKNFMRMSVEFQKAGLYYPWGYWYNSDLKFDDMLTEYNKKMESK